ncbi:hypothetical protein [Nesterenkonia pannonica]|uniref:hypothetical protein n=1 Tax=Nesterenkonia pannonica TaxID=1548602 RepID=UPI0021646CA3|nr:hypothetical protein [Nesterenkonia pannonica]
MFHHEADYPTAVTSADNEGLRSGFQWCIDHMKDGDHLTVWTHLKGNLGNNKLLEQFVSSHHSVNHITARGGAYLGDPGPVLMAWADPNDIAKFLRFNGNQIRALCVISWDEKRLQPWVSAEQPELLGDTSAWQEQTQALDPVVEEGMKSLTLRINHNNTIAAGSEKDDVVSMLLALHDAGYALDGPTLAGWAIAHGWTGGNPAQLEKYVQAIQRGSRPRVRRGYGLATWTT